MPQDGAEGAVGEGQETSDIHNRHHSTVTQDQPDGKVLGKAWRGRKLALLPTANKILVD
jgi:hypothetical protein